MTRHLVKSCEMLWYTSLGLFLGLQAGTILAVVEAFDSSRKVDASPGLSPYNDPLFVETANEVVAGFMAQNMFKNGGMVVLVLLGIAVLSRFAYPFLVAMAGGVQAGSHKLSGLQLTAIILCAVLMLAGTKQMLDMNRDWPGLYDLQVDQDTRQARRTDFDAAHKTSERFVGIAWFAGAFALVVSPWCQRHADESSATDSTSSQ